MPLLEINNLHAEIPGREILRGVDLSIGAGEVHAIMGKNGSGKSTLAQVLMGKEVYEVSEGSVTFDGKDLLEMSTEERAREGMFIAFQYPVEIPGVSTSYFLRAAVNEIREHQGKKPLTAVEFLKVVREKMDALGMDPSFMNRAVNEGFSGGEKKRNEVFQMAVCDPRLCIMDETDSGLDIDALKTVAGAADRMRDGKKSFLVVTHYQRMLDYIKPDHVHVMLAGRIVKSGGPELALRLEDEGYDKIEKEALSAA